MKRRFSFWEDEEYIRYQYEMAHYRGHRPLRNLIFAYSMEDAVHWLDMIVGPVLAQDKNTMELLLQDPGGQVHTFEVVTNDRALRGPRDVRILLVTDRMIHSGYNYALTTRQAWMRDQIDQGVLNFGWFVKTYAHVLADTNNTREVNEYDLRPLRRDYFEL